MIDPSISVALVKGPTQKSIEIRYYKMKIFTNKIGASGLVCVVGTASILNSDKKRDQTLKHFLK